jgi:arabinofuranosyltransferase
MSDLNLLTQTDKAEKKLEEWLPIVFFLAAFFMLILRRAWLSDDAYITYRTVDNLVNGFRLTWNTPERVQGYTHPLWMFLLSLVYLFTHEMYFTAIVVSLVISMAAVGLFSLRLAKSTSAALLGLLVLGFSNAFVDYSTSGLENPLTHLLLILFFLVFFHSDFYRPRILFWLSVIASLATVNRMDSLLLFAPALLAAWLESMRKGEALKWVALGQVPLVVWELFSVFYYGFPFPNTAYAKLNTGIPGSELALQGLSYLKNSLVNDPLTLTVILVGIITALVTKNWRWLAAGFGIILYLLYVVKIGGDFMSGRFLAAPLLAAVVVISQVDMAQFKTLPAALIFAAVVGLGLSAPLPSYRTDPPQGMSLVDASGVADERAWYFKDVGLINARRGISMPTAIGHPGGLAARAASSKDLYMVTAVKNVGFFGYYAGPQVYVIDSFALTDPLLARLPAHYDPAWRIGHFRRVLPDGYIQSAYAGKNMLEDPALGAYYEQLLLVTRGSLFNPRRWEAIWKLNTGQSDYLIDVDRYRYAGIEAVSASVLEASSGGRMIPSDGLNIQSGKVSHESGLQIELSVEDSFHIIFRGGGKTLGKVEVPASFAVEKGLVLNQIAVPLQAVEQGYEEIWLIPSGGEEPYQIGRLATLQ